MRTITSHIDPFGAADLKIIADDTDSNAGGASHKYAIEIDGECIGGINYQHGPRGIDGKLTGCIDSAILAIAIDRLECFQAGPFAHESNARALSHLRDAADILRSRAAERKGRGVLGANKA